MSKDASSRAPLSLKSILVGGIAASLFALSVLPSLHAHAFSPFGGAISNIIFCVNGTIYTNVGPPRGGEFIWAAGLTRSYEFGPPAHGGQWLLGMFGPPNFCLVSLTPVITFSGLTVMFHGSSQ